MYKFRNCYICTALFHWACSIFSNISKFIYLLCTGNTCTLVTIESSLSEGGREIDEKEATCYLFAVGELCRLSPAHTSSHLTLVVHSLLLATREGDGGGWCVCVCVEGGECVCVMEEIVLSLLLATRVRVGFVSLMVMPATRNGD